MKITIELEIDDTDRNEFLTEFARFFEFNPVSMSLESFEIDANKLTADDIRHFLPHGY